MKGCLKGFLIIVGIIFSAIIIIFGVICYQADIKHQEFLNEFEESKNPKKSGSVWVMGSYLDKFGDPTKEKYITNKYTILGKFSNTATQNSMLIAKFLIEDSSNIALKLFEYGRDNPVKNYYPGGTTYTIDIKVDDGSKIRLYARNNSDRLWILKGYSELLHEALKKYYQLKFYIVEDDSPSTNYNFTVNAQGYTATYNKLIN